MKSLLLCMIVREVTGALQLEEGKQHVKEGS
jgi:hypothetical protein